MSLDTKAIATYGYGVTTASELTVRIATWGYIGAVAAYIPVFVAKASRWISLNSKLKLR